MSPLFNYLLIPLLVAVFLALNMGGSGTGPSFSVAYGSNIIRRSLIPGLFGIMVFLGAILAGKATATTVGKDIIDPLLMNHYLVSIILFSVAISLLLANLLGIPQSTSQSTVLALSGAAVYFNVLNTAGIIGVGVAKLGYKNIFKKTEVNRFFLVWLIAPVIAFLLSLFLTFLFDRAGLIG